MSATNKTNNQTELTFTGRCVETYKAWLAEIEQAKEMIVNEFNETLDAHGNLFRLALNEAEALAGQTEYPHLVYPALAAERVQAVANWRKRQALIQQRPLLAAA
jgi:hypothetical protein